MNSYDVKVVGSDVLRSDRIPWEENCALFVMPGGRDLMYLDEFHGSNFIQRLRNSVFNGKMKYLGLCAGAYFAADHIEFEIGRAGYEVKGDRPLKLIKSPAVGTLNNNKFFYSNDPDATKSQILESLQAVTVKLKNGKEIKLAYNGGCYFPDEFESILACYSEKYPAILLSDTFCLSGVHFEYDPIDCLSLENKSVFSELMKYENDRKDLIREILTRLGLIVKETNENDVLECINIYTNDPTILNLKFKDKFINLISNPNPKTINNFTLYSPICTSTQTILLNEPELLDELPNYTVYVADHQVNGRGRSGNFWISSPACLQFTLKVEYSFNKSNRLPLLQFLMAVSITETINSFKFRSNDLKARIKWPNDIYLTQNKNLIGKLSGILVNCTQSHKKSVNQVLIGVGINLLSDPSLPNITHLNDYLQSPCDKETFLTELLDRFKYVYETFMQSDRFPFEDYYANWLHSSQQIHDESGKPLRINGIDEFGYLLAVSFDDGKVYKFEPDGNSFDMMKNLIKRK